MHCNQPFCGNGFTTGQFISQCGYNPFRPPPQNNGLYPEIVGEGEVTSVTLPDGTVQYFFIPTIKWWAPQTVNSYPYFNNLGHTNHNQGYYGSNITAWFVRTITNPRNPQPDNNNPCFRHEGTSLANTSEHTLNNANTGHQLKFHYDKWTSTTHLQYFFPQRVRQFDCTFSLPTKDSAAIQVDTPMTTIVRHYGSVCSKPCNCKTSLSHCSKNPSNKDLNKSKSTMSFTDVLVKSENLCDPTCPEMISKNVGCVSNKQLHLLPNDSKMQRIKLFDKPETKSQCTSKSSQLGVKQDPLYSSSKVNDENESISKRVPFEKKADYDWPSADKSMMTFNEAGCGGDSKTSVEMQCNYDNTSEKPAPTTWCPKTESVAKYFQCTPTDLSDSSSCSCCLNPEDDINDVINLI